MPSDTEKSSAYQHWIENLPAWVKAGEITILEIQHRFVWHTIQVRNLDVTQHTNAGPAAYHSARR